VGQMQQARVCFTASACQCTTWCMPAAMLRLLSHIGQLSEFVLSAQLYSHLSVCCPPATKRSGMEAAVITAHEVLTSRKCAGMFA
jgi:hypothetical protein